VSCTPEALPVLCRGANQEATECVHDGILSYGSDMSQEPGLPLIFEPIFLLALDSLMTLNLTS
jgi:hypothetical protein